jgi:hypothetical protein
MKLSIRSPHRGRFSALSFGSLLSIAAFGVAVSPGASAQLAAPDGGVPGDAGAPSPDTQPVPITVLTTSPATARGLIFVTPTSGAARPACKGAEIVDGEASSRCGSSQLPAGTRVRTTCASKSYRHEPVLTWIESQGRLLDGADDRATSRTGTIT